MKVSTRIDDQEERRLLRRFHAVLLIASGLALAAGVAANIWRLYQ